MKNRLMRFPITPHTSLESSGLMLPSKNLFDYNPIRKTHHFDNYLQSWIFKSLWKCLFWRILKQNLKISKIFWRYNFSKNGKNKAFYASDYDKIRICRVTWVQSFPTKCVVWSETAPIDFSSLRRAEVAIFSWFSRIFKNSHKNLVGIIKKCLTANVTFGFVGLEKFSNRYYHPTCVLVSFSKIISIRRIKREHHTTWQSDFTTPNVRR